VFVPFMRQVVGRPQFATAPVELLSFIQADAAELSEVPFIELLAQEPEGDESVWSRQGRALTMLEQIAAPDMLNELAVALAEHPSDAIRTWARKWHGEVERQTQESRRGGIELVRIEAGRFLMGSPATDGESDLDEKPQHGVAVSPFLIGRSPITNEEYGRFLQDTPKAREPDYWSERRFNGARQPGVGVSWEDAKAFAEWAGGRLLSEAEWEYAARAGTTTRYWWGDEFEAKRVNCRDSGSEWGGQQTSPVDAFPPNPWGLHDMSGNVWEWLQDCWHNSYENAPADGSAWLKAGRGDCIRRVFRGGSWDDVPGGARSAFRGGFPAGFRNFGVGFRLAQDID
jgi:formylglycine-generating enzyme required for sulfatase activity